MMWSTLVLAAAMAATPAQTGTLTLGGARVTHGELGPQRPDSKYFPGDIFFLSFDIEGISVDDSGNVKYVMEMAVTDKVGKEIFKQQPAERSDFLPLGGNKLPARAFVSIGLDQLPGTYTCTVKVTDKVTKAVETLKRPFEVVEKTFSLVQVYTAGDPEGKIPAPAVGVSGQSVWVHFALVGFERDKVKKLPSIVVEMEVTGKDGVATLKKPTTVVIDKDVPESDIGIPLRFLLPMNRPGDFTVKLKATDKVSGKMSTVSLPILVLSPTR